MQKAMVKRLFWGCVLATCLGTTNVQAQGSDPAMAQLLYKEATGLMDQGKYAEACPKLVDSDRLDPSVSTKGNLADCYEQIGRIASAWKLFEVVAVASRDNKQFYEYARTRAEKLIPLLPKIKIDVSAVSGLPGLEVKRDGEVVGEMYWGKDVPVDPGPHKIVVMATNKEPWETSQSVDKKEAIVVKVPLLKDPPATRPAGDDSFRRVALGLGFVGTVGIVAGSITGGLALSKYNEALDNYCIDRKPNMCSPKGEALGKEVGSLHPISTGMFIAGGVGLAAAGVFWYLSAKPAAKSTGAIVLPTITPDRAAALVVVPF